MAGWFQILCFTLIVCSDLRAFCVSGKNTTCGGAGSRIGEGGRGIFCWHLGMIECSQGWDTYVQLDGRGIGEWAGVIWSIEMDVHGNGK